MHNPDTDPRQDFIAPVCLQGDDVQPDAGTAALLAGEQEYVGNWRHQTGRAGAKAQSFDDLTGLALSGGGIRSAMFSLGVLQALAARNLLARFDYLSTVSGGGYIGSALSWLTSRKANAKGDAATPFDCTTDGFPFGTDEPSSAGSSRDSLDQKAMMQFLRQHGDYLNPGGGISLLSLVGVILRGLLLNLMIWMPVFILINLLGLHLAYPFRDLPLTLLPMIMDVKDRDVLHGYEFLIWLALGLLLLSLLGVLFYSLVTRFKRGQDEAKRLLWYRLRRRSEKILAVLLPTIVICLVVGILPALNQLMTSWWFSTGPGAILAGVGMAIVKFVRSLDQSDAPPVDRLLPVIAILLIYGTTLVTFRITYQLIWPEFTEVNGWPSSYAFIVAALVAFAGFFGILVNLNYVSVHRYYRDRLMETFMPDLATALRNQTSAANDADGGYLAGLSENRDPTGPYHIVNTNIVLVGSRQPKYRLRGGDNFILSPRYCGSNATGWLPTAHYMKGHMTLPTAVAISGAAANPNAGVGGVGITRNKPLSLVMSFLNVRLGYWAQNPGKAYFNPNYFYPGMYDFLNVLGFGSFREDLNFVQLSDGGHFENTAIYELVRRRLRLILACDGGADPAFSFSDFQTTVRRIEDDFGARVFIDPRFTPDAMIPRPSQTTLYPEKREFSERGFMICRIVYRDGSEGTLVYLKTALTGDVSFKVKGYAAENADFPDQPTSDQFFDEVQVEAYRELGYRIATSMMAEVDLAALLGAR